MSAVTNPSTGTFAAPSASRLVAVRHGATEWSQTRRHTGRTDLPLEEDGSRQAVDVGLRLGDHQFALVLTSPLERARLTCELAGFGSEALVCEDLAEWDYGTIEGKTTAEIREEQPGWDIWRDGPPGGETVEQVGERADRVISLVREQHGDVLVFAHAHILRILGCRWLGLPATYGRHFLLSPATISILDWERETPVISCWNDSSGDPLAD
jgi:broad specificity phosphatase PhoE